MRILCKCGQPISEARAKLADTCLQCGQKAAEAEIKAKSSRIGVAYNKGGLVYLGDETVAKQALRDTMGAQGRSTAALGFDVTPIAPTAPAPITEAKVVVASKKKRLPTIGILWLDGQAYSVTDRNDPRLARASRSMFFTEQSIRRP